MVKPYTRKEVNAMNYTDIKKLIKKLEEEGYQYNNQPLDASKEIATAKTASTDEEKVKYLRKVVRHTLDLGKQVAEGKSPRFLELEKMVQKSKTGEPDLRGIAKSLRNKARETNNEVAKEALSDYTGVEKDELIKKIIKAEKALGVENASSPVLKESKPKSVSKKSKSPSPMCGKYDYEDLMSKKLKDLKEILEKKGVKDSSKITSKEEAVDLVCQVSQNKEFCDSDYGCSDDKVCNVSTKPGICVDSDMKAPATLKYKGKTIIGNIEAINKLKQKLEKCGPKNDYSCSDGKVCDIEAQQCIKEKNVDPSYKTFEYKGKKIVGTKDAIKMLKKKLGVAKQSCSEDNDFSCPGGKVCDIDSNKCIEDSDELAEGYKSFNYNGQKVIGSKQAIKLFKQKVADPEFNKARKKLLRKAMKISNKNSDEFSQMTKENLEEFIENYTVKEKPDEDEVEEVEEVQEVEEVVKPKKKRDKVSPKQEEDEGEEDEKEDEDSVKKERSRQEKINIKDVQDALVDVVSGKKKQIEQFTEVQEMVLKCLGLVKN